MALDPIKSGRPLPRALPPVSNELETNPVVTPRRKKPRPQNNSNQNLADEDSNTSKAPRPSTRRPLPSASAQNNEQTTQDDDTQSQPRRTRRRKKRLNPQEQSEETTIQNNHAISSLLHSEDVVAVDKIEEAVALTNLPGYTAAIDGVNSAPNDKVFVQTTNGFAQHNRNWLDSQHHDTQQLTVQNIDLDFNKASYVANQIQQVLMYIALLLHGAFAGITIWHAVEAFNLSSVSDQNFLIQYQTLAGPTQTVFFVILILCTLSVFDRYDLGGKDKNIIIGLKRFDGMAWGCFFYFTALMFSIGLAGLDYWITKGYGIETTTTPTPSSATSTQSPNPELNVTSTLQTWRVLVIIRAVMATIGWLIISSNPQRSDLKFDD